MSTKTLTNSLKVRSIKGLIITKLVYMGVPILLIIVKSMVGRQILATTHEA